MDAASKGVGAFAPMRTCIITSLRNAITKKSRVRDGGIPWYHHPSKGGKRGKALMQSDRKEIFRIGTSMKEGF